MEQRTIYRRKQMALAAALSAAAFLTPVSVYAENSDENPIQITVTEAGNDNGEFDSYNLSLLNNGIEDLQTVEVEIKVPDQAEVSEQTELTAQFDSFASGDSKDIPLSLKKKNTQAADAGGKNNNQDTGRKDSGNPGSKSKTGVDENQFLWIILGFLSFSLMAACTVLIKRTRKRSLFLFLLGIGLGVNLVLPAASEVSAEEPSVGEGESQEKFTEKESLENLTLPGSNSTSGMKITVRVSWLERSEDSDRDYFETEPDPYDDPDLVVSPDQVEEPDAREMTDVLTDRTGTTATEDDESWTAPNVRVDYTLSRGTGDVFISDISESSYMSRIPGIIGSPVEIDLINDDLENAVISFSCSGIPAGTSIDNLGIVWYDEENEKIVPIESYYNSETDSICASTVHFSKYALVNLSEWYEKWAFSQLVLRDELEEATPYFNIVYVLDDSGSMNEYNRITLCKNAVKQFINNLQDDDMVSVVSFNSDTQVYIDNQRVGWYRLENGDQTVNGISANGGTDFDRGLYTGLSQILKASEADDGIVRQNLMIFLSDGEPTTQVSNGTMQYLRDLSESSGIRVMTIGLGQGASASYLQEIAANGQGEYFAISDESQIMDVFEQINAKFVGSSQDSDGDGIPDLVETTGMRTQFGDIIHTDPNNPDTDGDGISDRDEIGYFEFVEDGKSYFILESDPTVPTVISDESSIHSVSAVLKSKASSDFVSEQDMPTYRDLEEHFRSMNLVSLVRADKRKLAKDGLSETIYQDAEVELSMSSDSDSCFKMNDAESIHIQAGAAAEVKRELQCKSQSPFTCPSSHTVQVQAVNLNGASHAEDQAEAQLNMQSALKRMMEKKHEKLSNEADHQNTIVTSESRKTLNTIEQREETLQVKDLAKVKDGLVRYLGIDAAMPETVKKAFLNVYMDPISRYVKDDSSQIDYSKCKNSADIVNKTAEAIQDGEDSFKFKADGHSYTAKSVYFRVGPFASLEKVEISGNYHNYLCVITSVGADSAESLLSNMKKLSDLKVKEAKEAVIKDSIALLNIDPFIKDLKKIGSEAAIKKLNNVGDYINFPFKLGNLAKKLDKMKKIYEKLEKIEKMPEKITSSDYSDLVKNIKGVQDNFEKLYKLGTDND